MNESTPPPVPPPEPKPLEATAPAPDADGTGLAPNIAATICAALPGVGGIVFLVLEKKNAFVRFWAMQSVIFGGAMLAFSIVSRVAVFVFRHIPLLGWLLLILLGILGMILGVVFFVVWIITIIKAFSNVEWEIPFLGKLARRQLAGQQAV